MTRPGSLLRLRSSADYVVCHARSEMDVMRRQHAELEELRELVDGLVRLVVLPPAERLEVDPPDGRLAQVCAALYGLLTVCASLNRLNIRGGKPR